MLKNRKKSFRILFFTCAVLLLIALVCMSYLNDFYPADMTAIESFKTEESIETQTDKQGNLVFEPEEANAGLIFYPGGKVEYTAYTPLMESLASRGILCVLVEMPFHLAVFDADAADGIQEHYSQIDNWYLGGHSLGGAMAASYISGETDAFEGLILLGAYSTADLTGSGLEILSIYGSEDRVMNWEKYEESKENLPLDFEEFVIEGGCHAYFGMYGMQEGDGIPEITNAEQIEKTAQAVAEFMLIN